MILIARALAQGTAAVIMDEPTASLDFANRLRVQRIIRQLAGRGICVLLSSHDPEQAFLLGRDGLVACGPPGPR